MQLGFLVRMQQLKISKNIDLSENQIQEQHISASEFFLQSCTLQFWRELSETVNSDLTCDYKM